jgi:hypothetical protein
MLGLIQDDLQAYLLRGDLRVLDRIVPGPRDDRARRLAVYYDGYRSRLIEALAADFAGLAAALGEGAFREACAAYVEATPSRFRNLRWYGGGLAEFLMRTEPWARQPWQAELAQFEWALTLAFDAPDRASVGFEQLAALPFAAWGSLVLELHPSAQWLALKSNAAALRQAVEAEAALPAPAVMSDAQDWLVWRRETTPHFRAIEGMESAALQAVRGGATFPEMCEALCRWVEQDAAPAHAATLLRAWLDQELICGVRWGG